MKFPTGGKTEFDFELHDYSSILSDDRQSIVGENGSIGGLRIREIRYFDDITSNYVKRSRYFYKLISQ
ncbi:MAG: hypothetical protein IPJ13_22850 [Saprospiraceae bacterium]|nr:hypothetical protein [Saprospiraceae bacterium]